MGEASIHILATFLVSTIILVQVLNTSAQDNSGKSHFDLMVDNVDKIASNLSAIYDSNCDPNACSSCLQDMCKPLLKDSGGFCFKSSIPSSNLYNCSEKFNRSENVCPSIQVTTSRSSVNYLRWGSHPTDAQESALCRTYELERVFRSIWNLTPLYTEYYVGLVDGSRRSFPGREEGGEKCLAYDSRKRPWYSGAISYPNHLVILIDCGHTMSGDAQPGRLESRLEVASKFALALMETVYKDNYVNVFSFGASSNDTFGESIQVGFNRKEPENHPELENLKKKISSLSNLSSEIDTSPSDFAAGLTLALRAFNQTPIDGLLDVIIFTDGSFTDGSVESSVLDQVKRSNVHLFIYGINSGASTTGLENLKIQVNAFYRDLSGQDFTDPLLSVQSYFAYLAVSHKNLYNDTAFWTPNYEDYYVVGELVTVTKAVFTANNSFIGVAAIDVILEELGDTVKPDFETAVNKQRTLVQDLKTKNASNQTTASVPQPYNDSSCQYNVKAENLLCPPSVPDDYDPRKGKCCSHCGKGGGDDTKKTIGIIVGSVVGAVTAVLIATIATVAFVRRRKQDQNVQQGPVNVSPVPDGDSGRWDNPL